MKKEEISENELKNYLKGDEIKKLIGINFLELGKLRKENKIRYYRIPNSFYFYNINDVKEQYKILKNDIKPRYKNGKLIKDFNISEQYLNDQLMLELFYNNVQNLYFRYKKLGQLDKKFINYIKNRFPDSYSEYETWYMLKHNIYEKPKCPICGKPVKINFKHFNLGVFTQFCSDRCKNLSPDLKEKRKQTCMKKYGVENALQSEKIKQKSKKTCMEKYGVEYSTQSNTVKQKRKQTCLDKYGVEYAFQADEVKQKIQNTIYKHYGVNCAFQADEVKEKIKQTCIEKYGAENPFASEYVLNIFKQKKDEIQHKRDLTKKLHGTFEKSKKEDIAYELLKTIYPNLERSHKDNLYPFKCDFYDKDSNTYIEFQGMWTHGGHPFDPNNIDDINKVKKWKDKSKEINSFGKTKDFYLGAIKTWTHADPLKREIAKQNKLNYLEFWTIIDIKEFIKQYNNEES